MDKTTNNTYDESNTWRLHIDIECQLVLRQSNIQKSYGPYGFPEPFG